MIPALVRVEKNTKNVVVSRKAAVHGFKTKGGIAMLAERKARLGQLEEHYEELRVSL